MPVRIVTADERLSAANNKTSLAIFGPPGCGKTTLLKTLPAGTAIPTTASARCAAWPADRPVRTGPKA